MTSKFIILNFKGTIMCTHFSDERSDVFAFNHMSFIVSKLILIEI